MADWWVKSGTGGTDAGTSWANAAESIAGLLTAQAVAAGDTIYVHNTHNYLAGAAITLTMPESGTGLLRILCVDGGDATGASLVDGTVGNLATGASESTNGNFAYGIVPRTACSIYIHGLTLKTGANANSTAADININTGSAVFCELIFSACLLYVDSTNTGATLSIGSSTGGVTSTIRLINTQIRQAHAGSINLGRGLIDMRNCSIHASSTAPTTLFSSAAGAGIQGFFSGCDWSAATNVFNQSIASQSLIVMRDCVIGTPVTGTHAGIGYAITEFHACGPADGTNGPDLLNYYYEDAYGVIEDDQSVYLTTGSAQGKQDDGTDTAYAWKLTPSANVSSCTPLRTPWIYVYVGSTGSKTFTVKCADTESAVLKNSELWLEVEYVGGSQLANSPQSQWELSAPLVSGTIYQDVVAAGSNLTDTGEAWTGITETGTYSLAKTVTVDEYGYVRCRVALAKDTTSPVYVDPKIAVT